MGQRIDSKERLALSQVITNRMHGYLRMRIAQFLTVIHPTPHTIYLTRHGQSEYNVVGKIGGIKYEV